MKKIFAICGLLLLIEAVDAQSGDAYVKLGLQNLISEQNTLGIGVGPEFSIEIQLTARRRASLLDKVYLGLFLSPQFTVWGLNDPQWQRSSGEFAVLAMGSLIYKHPYSRRFSQDIFLRVGSIYAFKRWPLHDLSVYRNDTESVLYPTVELGGRLNIERFYLSIFGRIHKQIEVYTSQSGGDFPGDKSPLRIGLGISLGMNIL